MDQRLSQSDTGDSPPDRAAYWMMRKMSGAMDAAERTEFSDWLAASPANARAFTELDRMLDRVDASADMLLSAEFERQLAAEAHVNRRATQANFFRIAATIAAVAITATVAISLRDSPSRQPAAYATAIGQSKTVVLDDGSQVELNTSSRMAVAYNHDRRNVDLQAGEAFFSVEKDRSRPFIVKTGQAEVAVTGTSFSVSTENGLSSVHVLTGVVDVAPLTGPSATLLAGDTIEVGATGFTGPVSRYDPGLVLAWRTGKARFRDEPLGKVIADLNRYFEGPITLGDETLADLRVTGEFDIRDRATAVKALALIFDLDSRDDDGRVLLTRAESQ